MKSDLGEEYGRRDREAEIGQKCNETNSFNDLAHALRYVIIAD
jgi:hypothetical protein